MLKILMRVRSLVVVVVWVLVVVGCGGSDFEDRARALHDETRADWQAIADASGWEFVLGSQPAVEEARDFDFSREHHPEASEGGLSMRARPEEKIATVAQLQPLTTALADVGYVLRRSSCGDTGLQGVFENADGGALWVGITRWHLPDGPASVSFDTTLTMDHRLSTVDELTSVQGIQPGCWPEP